MTEFRKTTGKAVEHKATKYDTFTLVKTEHPYKHQKGSGRSACFELAKAGLTIGAWAKKCAEQGYDSKFVVGSLIKLSGTSTPGWTFSEKNGKGQTLADVKKVRDVDPTKAAERSAKAKAAADAKAAKKTAKDAEAKAKADKAAKDAEKAKKAASGTTGGKKKAA